MKILIVAIDGPAGSGKSTTARVLAERLGFRYLDTGAMYRAAALALVRSGLSPESAASEMEAVLSGVRIEVGGAEERSVVRLDGEDVTEQIRRPEIGSVVSDVAAVPEVRHLLVEQQRRLAREFERKGRGVVLDGRDIGTYVFPDADVKVFMVADVASRAARRTAELRAKGVPASEEEVKREIERRDEVDSAREMAPLRAADDAVRIDTTRLTVDDQVAIVERLVRERSATNSV